MDQATFWIPLAIAVLGPVLAAPAIAYVNRRVARSGESEQVQPARRSQQIRDRATVVQNVKATNGAVTVHGANSRVVNNNHVVNNNGGTAPSSSDDDGQVALVVSAVGAVVVGVLVVRWWGLVVPGLAALNLAALVASVGVLRIDRNSGAGATRGRLAGATLLGLAAPVVAAVTWWNLRTLEHNGISFLELGDAATANGGVFPLGALSEAFGFDGILVTAVAVVAVAASVLLTVSCLGNLAGWSAWLLGYGREENRGARDRLAASFSSAPFWTTAVVILLLGGIATGLSAGLLFELVDGRIGGIGVS